MYFFSEEEWMSESRIHNRDKLVKLLSPRADYEYRSYSNYKTTVNEKLNKEFLIWNGSIILLGGTSIRDGAPGGWNDNEQMHDYIHIFIYTRLIPKQIKNIYIIISRNTPTLRNV